MLNFVNFKNGGTCVHQCILDAMNRVLSNHMMSNLTEYICLLGDIDRTVKIYFGLKKIAKKKNVSGYLALLASIFLYVQTFPSFVPKMTNLTAGQEKVLRSILY